MGSLKSIDKKIKNLRLHSEKSLESRLIKIVEAKNGTCKKLQGAGNKSDPDRICLLPCGKVWFVELKKPGKKPNPLQLQAHEKLRKLGFKVSVISSEQELKQFENEISGA